VNSLQPHNDGSLNGMDAVNVPGEVEARKARRWREGGYAVRKSPTFVSLSAGGARTASRPLGLDREEDRTSNELPPPLRVLPPDH
jgi:hypothetical protein